MEDDVRRLCHELVDAATAGSRAHGDFHDDIACPLPVIVIARMLGVPAGGPSVASSGGATSRSRAMGSTGPPTYGVANRQEMDDYFADRIAERRALAADGEPLPDDLMSALLTATGEHPTDGHRGLTDRELLGQLNQLLVGGNETTTSLLTNLAWRLLEEPARWERSGPTDRS